MAADDSDIPPLEDMTDVLKQANAIRQQLDRSNVEKRKGPSKAKAKVNKKHPTAHSVPSSDAKDHPATTPESQNDTNESKSIKTNVKLQSKPCKESSGLFGGMKKGFLFGAPNKPSAKSTPSTAQSSEKEKNKKDLRHDEHPSKEQNVEKQKSEEMPYITPKGKTESGLTFGEVQQAMSEAKGLLDNQDWVTEDLLNKVEKNDFLLKRFSDPHFMTALQEFQTNPEVAMAKYKGNKEVEKFLTEFCGLLGDHFTNMGEPDGNSSKNPKSTPPKSAPKVHQVPKHNSQAKSQVKIVEIGDDDDVTSNSEKSVTNTSSPLDQLTSIHGHKFSSEQMPSVKTHAAQSEAEIQEMKNPSSDSEVKEALSDPKVMETLMNPEVMRLIQTLKDDPIKGQRIVDEADSDLRSKIQFLVSKGLLQFQTG